MYIPRRRRAAHANMRLVSTIVGLTLLSLPDASYGQGLNLMDVVKTTLERNIPILLSQEEVRIRDAERQIVLGAFDVHVGFSIEGSRTSRLFSEAEQAAYSVAAAYTGSSTYRAGASRLFRSGIRVSPIIEFVRQDALTLRSPPLAQTQMAVEVSYPILNFGAKPPEAAELESAELLRDASRLHAGHVRAESIYRAAEAYWAYLGAFESLKILADSEEKAERLLQETRALVQGGERAAADLDQLRADVADRFAARVNAEQRLFAARQQLGIEMGLTSGEAATLPPPTSPIPDVLAPLELPPPNQMKSIAGKRRRDLAGSRKSAQAAAASRYARRLQSRARLDLTLSVGYAGLSEDRLSFGHHLPPFGQNQIGGSNASVSLVLSWPTSNHRAFGLLERADATWRQAQLSQADLDRRIRSNLRVASERVHTTVSELMKMTEAVALYAAAVENEKKRLQLGMSTQFDLILVEERHRNSLIALVNARIRYAAAVARLRFETGTLTVEGQSPEGIARALTSPVFNVD